MKCPSITIQNAICQSSSIMGELAIKVATGSQELDHVAWDAWVSERNAYMLSSHARYFEEADFIPHFVTITSDDEIVMQVLCYDSPLNVQHVGQNLNSTNWFIKKAYRLGMKVMGADRRMLICGHPHMVGDLGVAHDANMADHDVVKLMDDAINTVQSKHGVAKLAVAKEFIGQSWTDIHIKGFENFKADNNYVMPLDPSWSNIEDYAAVLTSKYRTKWKGIKRKAEELSFISLSADEIRTNASKITDLYKEVLAQANFYLGKITAEHLAMMKEENEKAFSLVGVFNSTNEMVGFLSSWQKEGQLDAFLVGMNYDYVQSHSLYNAILYKYIEMGIQAQTGKIVFGRTGGLAKSSVGAFPELATCYITHRSLLVRTLMKVVFTNVKPSEYPYRNPWKKEAWDEWEQAGKLSGFDIPLEG